MTHPEPPSLEAPEVEGDPITPDELGVAALPADATPAQRARAEAVWRPSAPDQPCRCSGNCPHGTPCGGTDCEGVTVHVDRYPGAMFSTITWADDYLCSEECDEGSAWQCGPIDLPEIPWGYRTDSGIPGSPTLHTYPGVRHPNFTELDDEDEDVSTA